MKFRKNAKNSCNSYRTGMKFVAKKQTTNYTFTLWELHKLHVHPVEIISNIKRKKN